ncbi:MFS transporter [Aquibacillus halophilus]|uniref:MFS transporter n=1 Tax=Aquibacillus halophilus TaxID=930132 RepID=A0A6A8DBS0_9BACI|nr:MFS transporter [Aquibacillus halophilus]MRH42750.1 MFS transporter [Aquibacillus halophilus]
MSEQAVKENQKNYPLMTFALFWAAIAVMCGLYMTIPLISTFASTFEVSHEEAAWAGSSFSIFFAIGCLFYGALSDRYGRKIIIVIGLVVSAFVTTLIGTVDTLTALIIMRAIQGAAAATFSPVALSYAGDMFPSNQRGTTIGFISTGFLLAGIIGQVLSSVANQWMEWHDAFFILGAIYFITMLLILLILPKDEIQQPDGNILAPFKHIRTIARQPSLLLCYVIAITILLSFVGMYTSLENYLTGPEYQLTTKDILYIRSVGIIGMLLCPFTGKLVSKFGFPTVLRGGFSLAIIGLVALALSNSLMMLIIMSVVFVTGIAILVPTLISLVGQLGGKSKGLATSIYTFVLFIGASLGPILSIYLLNTGIVTLPFYLFALLLSIGFVLTYFIHVEK